MRRFALLFAILAVPAFAEDKAKPNTLTPKEIADGWILLFDGETTFGWKVEGEAKVKDGTLVLDGRETISTVSRLMGHSTVSIEVQVSDDGVKWTSERIDREADVGFDDGALGKSIATFEWTRDRQLVLSVGKRKTTYLRSIKAKPGGMRSLFNAKDLTGWKEFKPTKDKKIASKFTVTKEGWLNVKDGPGDLQTEGQWADFVLQLECISNGKHLNSGLFFRCIPDLYQQGYEAQIRNQWEGDDRTRPVDFGTGAIYRRQPARKVVSTDGEWFTMTVAAHGRHIATWVNGYQVVDWTDDRKESDNARQGFKKGKGAISIQGHDPTTDLSFRNIRIQSLDAK
jgi:hypothetical protein